jgi:hypothetical protein
MDYLHRAASRWPAAIIAITILVLALLHETR